MKRSGGVFGVTSLVTILCVLCLSVFAILTLSTAERERRLAELTAEYTAAYYEADRQAAEWAAALPTDGVLNGQTASASFPAGGEQVLEVELRKRGDAYRILRWQLVYEGEWKANETIEIWDGD